MADGTVGVKQSTAPDRLIDNEALTIGAQTVYRQRVRDPDAIAQLTTAVAHLASILAELQATLTVDGTVAVSNFPATQPVSGPLTDTQLRAASVPVSTGLVQPLTDTQLRAAAVPVSGPATDSQLRASPLPVSGPLTDSQLRAAAVPVSTGLAQPLTDSQLRAAAVPVSGPLTDAQMRATAVAVSGPLTDAQLRVAAVPVATGLNPLTDAQLRAAAVAVSGPLTDLQLRASALAVVDDPLTLADSVRQTSRVMTALSVDKTGPLAGHVLVPVAPGNRLRLLRNAGHCDPATSSGVFPNVTLRIGGTTVYSDRLEAGLPWSETVCFEGGDGEDLTIDLDVGTVYLNVRYEVFA